MPVVVVRCQRCWMLAATCVWRLELNDWEDTGSRAFGSSVLDYSLRVSDVMNQLYMLLLALGRGSQAEAAVKRLSLFSLDV